MDTEEKVDEDGGGQEESPRFTNWLVGFEPGNLGRNLAVGIFYVVCWPVGILLVFASIPINWKKTGTLHKAWFILTIVSLVGVGILAANADIPATAGAQGDTNTPEKTVRCWMDENQNEIRQANERLTQGTTAFENGDGSRSLMHLEKAMKKYRSLNESAHRASIGDEGLEQLLEGYFYHAFQGVSATYSGVYELEVNDDPNAAERMAERQGEHFDQANQEEQMLKERLGVDRSADFAEIGITC